MSRLDISEKSRDEYNAIFNILNSSLFKIPIKFEGGLRKVTLVSRIACLGCSNFFVLQTSAKYIPDNRENADIAIECYPITFPFCPSKLYTIMIFICEALSSSSIYKVILNMLWIFWIQNINSLDLVFNMNKVCLLHLPDRRALFWWLTWHWLYLPINICWARIYII